MWNGNHFGPSWSEVPQGIQRRSPSGTSPTLFCPLFHVPIDNTFRPGSLCPCSVPWGRPGARGQSHRKSYRLPPIQRSRFCRIIARKKTGSIFPDSVPRFRQDHDTAKIRPVKGLRVEICDSKYYPALDWSDRRSGLIAGRSYVTIYRFLIARKAA